MLNYVAEHQEFTIVLAFVLLLVVSNGYIFKFRHIPIEKKYELATYTVSALSILFVIYNILLTVESSKTISRDTVRFKTLENVERMWLSPQKEMLAYYPESYFLYATMTPDAELDTTRVAAYDKAKRSQVEVAFSNKIFQDMEDFLTVGKYDLTGQSVWLNNFIMWMQSPILRRNWERLGFNYGLDTRELVASVIRASEELIQLRARKGRLTDADYDARSGIIPVHYR